MRKRRIAVHTGAIAGSSAPMAMMITAATAKKRTFAIGAGTRTLEDYVELQV